MGSGIDGLKDVRGCDDLDVGRVIDGKREEGDADGSCLMKDTHD